MGDRVSTQFRFSGKLPSKYLAELEQLVRGEGFTSETLDVADVLEFDEVNYAQHDDLWDFARTHNLDWAMSWGQGGGFGPRMIISRSGVEIECGYVGGDPAVTRYNIEAMCLGDLDAVLTFLAQFKDLFNQPPPLEIIHE